jgi:ATP-dependent DNA helicase DinG
VKLVDNAFERLANRSGFASRPAQVHLARLISDLIESGATGLFEAPTGLGKSLAALVPAVANAIVHKRRTVIATYTNVLAEQYWRSDLPLAMSLFEEAGLPTPKAQLLMGRQRYACLEALETNAPDVSARLTSAEIGHESEFKKLSGLPVRQANALWTKVATPPVCPARACRFFGDCFYYRARRQAAKAAIVITNHSVVVQHALMTRQEEGDGLLGEYDFLLIDEAHDFPLAAQNGLEFELSPGKLRSMAGIASRIEHSLRRLAEQIGEGKDWAEKCAAFRDELQGFQQEIVGLGLFLDRPGILDCAPQSLLEHPQVQNQRAPEMRVAAARIAEQIQSACVDFEKEIAESIDRWEVDDKDSARIVTEEIVNYRRFLTETALSTSALFDPQGVAVTYIGRDGQDPLIRQDVIGLSEPLRDLIWGRSPYACISATAALDGGFNFFKRLTGAEPMFEEVLPSPFDFTSQSAVYLPPAGKIPDPSEARKNRSEDVYFRAVATQLEKIIRTCRGRTLALFHSRREMEAVRELIHLPEDLPIHIQGRQNAARTGEKFLEDTHSSLFALRSFWTGFDAPGETLSCVVLVRVPFEVPVEPPQIARMAYLQQQGLSPFAEHTLPLAKMLMRQGAGRLIRRAEDRGIIALLDPRLRSKRYGEEILDNLPQGMRAFDDIEEAVAFIGLE